MFVVHSTARRWITFILTHKFYGLVFPQSSCWKISNRNFFFLRDNNQHLSINWLLLILSLFPMRGKGNKPKNVKIVVNVAGDGRVLPCLCLLRHKIMNHYNLSRGCRAAWQGRGGGQCGGGLSGGGGGLPGSSPLRDDMWRHPDGAQTGVPWSGHRWHAVCRQVISRRSVSQSGHQPQVSQSVCQVISCGSVSQTISCGSVSQSVNKTISCGSVSQSIRPSAAGQSDHLSLGHTKKYFVSGLVSVILITQSVMTELAPQRQNVKTCTLNQL